jgi:hypothetical protein
VRRRARVPNLFAEAAFGLPDSARLAGVARLAGFAWLAACAARATGAGRPACPSAAAVTAMAAVAAMPAGSAMAAGSTLAAAAVTAGGIEEGRAADGVDHRVDRVSAGGGCGGQRGHRRSNKHTGGRTEPGHTTAMSQDVARLAVSLSAAVKSQCPASYERDLIFIVRVNVKVYEGDVGYAHILSIWVISSLRSFRIGS